MMKEGTIEQAREIVKRRRVFVWCFVALILFVIALRFVLLLVLRPDLANTIAAMMGMVGLSIMILLSVRYWICPACGEYLPRIGRHCKSCDTVYDLNKSKEAHH